MRLFGRHEEQTQEFIEREFVRAAVQLLSVARQRERVRVEHEALQGQSADLLSATARFGRFAAALGGFQVAPAERAVPANGGERFVYRRFETSVRGRYIEFRTLFVDSLRVFLL